MTNSATCRRWMRKERSGSDHRRLNGGVVIWMSLVALLLCVWFRPTVVHATDADDLDFRVELSQVREMYEGSYLPLTITASSSKNDYSGWLDLTVCQDTGSYLLYSQEIDITAGRTHTALFAFPVHIGSNMRILLQFRSKSGEYLFSRFYTFSASLRGATRKELVLGLVGQALISSESRFEITAYERETFLTDVQSYLVDPRSIGTDITSILCYDILYLSDDYLDVYSPEVIRNLINWTAQGGILVIGGVVDKNREERLRQLMIESVKQRDFERFMMISGNYYLLGDGVIYTYDYDYFSGYVYFPNQIRSMLRSVFYNMPDPVAERTLDMKDLSDYQEEIFEELPSWRFGIPSFKRYMLIILIYIFLALPAAYLLLRRIRKHYYLQGTILLLAVAFAVLIYILGAKSRMSLPHSSLLSIEESYGDLQVTQRYLTLQTLYDKKASIYLRTEDQFRLQSSATPEASDSYAVWDHKPDPSAYSMEYSVAGDEVNVLIGKRQSGLFRFMSNAVTDSIETKDDAPLFVLKMQDGIPEDATESIYGNDTDELQAVYRNWLIRNYPDLDITDNSVEMLASYLKSHAYRFSEGDFTIEVYKVEGEEAAIVTRDTEMIKSSYVRFKITER
ncbi:MAG: hypothetical protein IKS10_09230 [Lachnospiraceae bacterium]|nr:hypothetical protein [Lachnospiraceae bacterium]